MKTIVIGDIHNHTETAEAVLSQEKSYDKVVFVGDYFDSFDDGAFEARRTAFWLKDNIRNPKFVFCIGNHDMPYLINHNDFLKCPGWTNQKNYQVRSVLSEEERSMFVPCHVDQGYLISHAGVHPKFMRPLSVCPDKPLADLVCEHFHAAYNELRGHKAIALHEFSYGGSVAGGMIALPDGGITWLRWDVFEPIPGLNQIVGHTGTRRFHPLGKQEVVSKHTTDSKNFNIDCLPTQYLVIEDGVVRAEYLLT